MRVSVIVKSIFDSGTAHLARMYRRNCDTLRSTSKKRKNWNTSSERNRWSNSQKGNTTNTMYTKFNL